MMEVMMKNVSFKQKYMMVEKADKNITKKMTTSKSES